MATSAIMGVKTTLDKKLQRSITNINPNAADSDIVDFIEGLNGLSTNTLTEVRRVDTTELLNDTRTNRNLRFKTDNTTTKTIQGSIISTDASEATTVEITGNGLTAENVQITRIADPDAQGYLFADWIAFTNDITGQDIIEFYLYRPTTVAETTFIVTVPATDNYTEGKVTLNVTATT